MVSQFYTYLHRRGDTGAVFYVGKGKDRRAWSASGRNQHWKNVVSKHGYTVEVLAHWVTEAESFEHERFLIACFRDLGAPLVNKTDGGEGKSGMPTPPEVRAKMSAASRGKKKSPEHVAKSSAAKRGCRLTEEHRAKIAASGRGRTHSAETRAKMSAAQKGREFSDDTRAKMAASATGRKHSMETRAKVSDVLRGRVVTAATRAKLSAAAAAAWARKKAAE